MSRRPLPPPLPQRPPGLWRDTPPALFPPLMGLLGLGLGWREAARTLGAPAGIGDLILGAAALLFLFCVVAWVSKPLHRPGVVIEDLRILPGRAGLAALVLSLSLLAAALVPFAPGLAWGVLAMSVIAHAGLLILVARVLMTGPPEGRVVTPVFHLLLVGPILLPLALIPLGATDLSRAILWGTIPLALAIWAISAVQLIRRIPPAPLRPLLAIHLAPASLFATVATMLGLPELGMAAAALGALILLALLLSTRWLTEARFTPLWGAFTFPMAAFATALLSISGGDGLEGILGGLLLVAATLAIPAITYKVLNAWAQGKLAAKTNAAVA